MLRSCTRPDWNGWIYYYNQEIYKLSYDEYDYKIDLTSNIPPNSNPFLPGDKLQRIIEQRWVTREVFDGLVNAFDFLFPTVGVRETAARIRHHYWEGTKVD